MGYFVSLFSLSKPATETALNCSEICLLVSTLILALGAVGEYSAEHDKLPRCIRWPKLVFIVIVVVSLVGEFFSEAGVYVFSAHLQSIADSDLSAMTKRVGDLQLSAETAAAAASRAEASAQLAKEGSAKAVLSASGAVKLAGDVRQEANAIDHEIGKASSQLSELGVEAQKTKSDLINLAICNAPRIITRWGLGGPPGGKLYPGAKSYVDPLRPMAAQLVSIEVVPDAEARRAASSIAQALLDAQWKLQLPLRFVDGLADGVSVQPWVPPITGSPKDQISKMHLYSKTETVAEKLLDFLHSYNWQAQRGWPTNAQGEVIHDEKTLPEGAIRIQVGLYPPAAFVDPPGQKELTSGVDKMNRETEKGMAEFKRQREEKLASLPPEEQERIKQQQEEWEARTKSETSSGPCQVLNPLQ